MTKIQDRRRQSAELTLECLLQRRETLLRRLVQVEAHIRATRKTLARYAKLPAAPAKTVELSPELHARLTAVIERVPPPPPADDIPPFLQRQAKATAAIDARAAAEILAQQEAARKTKAQVRIERMKAKQSGATKRMPLSGRAALAAIREGS